MIQYLYADLWRIGRRIPRWMIWILSLAIGVAVVVSASGKKNFNYVELGSSMETVLTILPAVLAMLNLYFVYEDDMQVKTMQIAIGRGTGRLAIIFSKWLQMVLLSIIDCVSLILVMNLTGQLLKGVVLRDHIARGIGAQAISTVLTVAVMTAIVMIFLFNSMHVGIMQIVFLVLCIKPFTLILNSLETRHEFLAELQLSNFMPGKNLDAIKQMITVGQFGVRNITVIIIYCILGIGITYMIFAKKELDF